MWYVNLQQVEWEEKSMWFSAHASFYFRIRFILFCVRKTGDWCNAAKQHQKKKPESGSIRELCSSKSLTYLYIYKHHFECQKIEWWSIHFMNEQIKASRWIVKMKSLHTIANVRVIVTWYAIMCNMILLLFCVLWYFKCANVYTHIF